MLVLAILMLSLAILCTAELLLRYYYRITSVVTIRTIGCKVVDSEGQPIAMIDWGIVDPGSTVSYECFVLNNGTIPITLNLTTENWNPPNASAFITLSWNYTGQLIEPEASLPITFILIVSPDISGITDFSFDSIITAKEVVE